MMSQLYFWIARSTTIALISLAGWNMLLPLAQAAPQSNATASYAKPITTQSGAAEIALAEHLTKIGAKMYGAYWCHHCHNQKQLFGTTAWQKISYVECAVGTPAEQQACQKAKVEAFPTWYIGGQKYVGTMSLFRLAKISGYNGSTAFQNARVLSR
jgi:glutaredoxin